MIDQRLHFVLMKLRMPEARIELTTFALRICRSRPTPQHPAAADRCGMHSFDVLFSPYLVQGWSTGQMRVPSYPFRGIQRFY